MLKGNTVFITIFDRIYEIIMPSPIEGFSKLSKEEKIRWIAEQYTHDPEVSSSLIKTYWNSDTDLQQLHDEFIENTLTNFYLPLGIAPNFFINGKLYAIPMAIEESSVVAAASKAAKYWLSRGGFKTKVLGTEKIGQVHFIYQGDPNRLKAFVKSIQPLFLSETLSITKNMVARGGGINKVELRDRSRDLKDYYQLHCTFETLDAMGANFINSCLEQFAKTLQREASTSTILQPEERHLEVVMSILSNYVPQCLVRAEVSCQVEDLGAVGGISAHQFAEKMVRAIAIANIEPFRAVTHNKGIMNGIDAVVLATGNDFRAVEAGIHAYASKDGTYKSLTHASLENDVFRYWIEIPLALGTVGGLTSLHPLAKLSLEILQNPSAEDLMGLVAVAGLAQNFGAVQSLVTTGIQQGHMKMHLLNILNQMGASDNEKKQLVEHFKKHSATHSAVVDALQELRKSL